MTDEERNQKPHEALGFRTQKAAYAHFRDMLYGLVPMAHEALLALVSHHPHADLKVGPGVETFYVAPSGYYGSHCFWIRRVDGTCIDFSVGQCLKTRRPA